MKRHCANMTREEKEGVAAKLKQIAGTANYRAVTDEPTLRAIYTFVYLSRFRSFTVKWSRLHEK